MVATIVVILVVVVVALAGYGAYRRNRARAHQNVPNFAPWNTVEMPQPQEIFGAAPAQMPPFGPAPGKPPPKARVVSVRSSARVVSPPHSPQAGPMGKPAAGKRKKGRRAQVTGVTKTQKFCSLCGTLGGAPDCPGQH